MLRRVLLDDDSWRVEIGLLAGIKVTVKHRGLTVKASTQERRYLLAMIEELQNSGIPIVPGNETLGTVLADFANSVVGRGGVSWQMFFTQKSPSENAKRYLG